MILPADDNQKTAIETLNEACGKNMSFLPPALDDLKVQLGYVQTHAQSLRDTASCHQISPLYKRITHGALCMESPYGLTVLWACSFLLCVLSFVMLTTRAALYNAVIPKKQRDKKPRRVVEKEFSEYKEYMKKYYQEADEWNLDEPIPSELKATTISLEFDEGLDTKSTFETAVSSNPSQEDDENENGNAGDGSNEQKARRLELDSQVGGFHPAATSPQCHESLQSTRRLEDDSYGSSYDSEISDDESTGDDSISDEHSAIASFISETKSIALQTLLSLPKVKPILNTLLPGSMYMQDFNDSNEKDQGDEDSLYLTSTSMREARSTPNLDPKNSFLLAALDDSFREVDMDESAESSPTDLGATRRKSNIRDGVWKEINSNNALYGRSARKKAQENHSFDRPRMLEALTPSSIISALTPSAPSKAFSFLSRSHADKKSDEDGGGMDNLNSPSPRHRFLSAFSSSPSVPSIQPKQLEMSPLLTPRSPEMTAEQEQPEQRPRRRQTFSTDFPSPTSTTNVHNRGRKTMFEMSQRGDVTATTAASTATSRSGRFNSTSFRPKKRASDFHRTRTLFRDDDGHEDRKNQR
mmetsp:Transcript_7875/g.13938  ORF Transcript_7875/g.13938 Transcript_7875/m.13938 type:complete len:584 (-) Transcript_7875:211-1962(-)